MNHSVCFIGGARYGQPLDATSGKKFAALAKLGRIFVIGFSADFRPRVFTRHARFYLLPCVPMPIARYLLMFTVGFFLTLWCVLRHGVHVLVAQSPYEGLPAAWAKALAALLGRRVVLVIECHGDFGAYPFLQRRVLLPWLYGLATRRAARLAMGDADLFRVVSNFTKQLIGRVALHKPVVQFPAWTDIDAFLQPSAEQESKERPRRGILFAGALIPMKGVLHLVDAFARIAGEFPETRLVILGREENRVYSAELKARVKQVGLNGQVLFGGEVPQAELAAWMSQACVFVLPSLSEGLGRVILEAMAAGTPVIGSRVGGIPEIIQDGVTGFLVPPRHDEALAERLRWVLAHPKEAREMGCRARVFADRFFSTKAYVHGYKQLLEAAQSLLIEWERSDAHRAIQSSD